MATPISWKELETLDRANGFRSITRPNGPQDKSLNPWPGYFDAKQPIAKAMLKAVGAE